jgi:hypothetical protein
VHCALGLSPVWLPVRPGNAAQPIGPASFGLTARAKAGEGSAGTRPGEIWPAGDEVVSGNWPRKRRGQDSPVQLLHGGVVRAKELNGGHPVKRSRVRVRWSMSTAVSRGRSSRWRPSWRTAGAAGHQRCAHLGPQGMFQ